MGPCGGERARGRSSSAGGGDIHVALLLVLVLALAFLLLCRLLLFHPASHRHLRSVLAQHLKFDFLLDTPDMGACVPALTRHEAYGIAAIGGMLHMEPVMVIQLWRCLGDLMQGLNLLDGLPADLGLVLRQARLAQ